MGLVLFVRPDCGLCEEARESLRCAGVEWSEVDITKDEEAYLAYWADVPVLEKDGEPVLMHRFSPEEVAESCG